MGRQGEEIAVKLWASRVKKNKSKAKPSASKVVNNEEEDLSSSCQNSPKVKPS